MDSIKYFGPAKFVGSTARILKNNEGNAVFDMDNDGKVGPSDTAVLTRLSAEMATGQVPMKYDALQAHVGSLGRASNREVAESIQQHEWAGSACRVDDVIPHNAPEVDGARHTATVFRFDAEQPYAEFIFSPK